MKLKTAAISIVVSAALVGAAGYGAYYVMQSQKTAVEVVPVSNVNVNSSWWGMTDSIYGSVTSQVAQTVTLDEEYKIDKIYVKDGDEVKEGDPLFSYDMTLPELQLEMEKLTLQSYELTMTKLEKDLEKLKKTTATASLEADPFTLTASAEEGLFIDEEPDTSVSETNAEDEGTKESETESAGTDGDGTSGSAGDVQIEGVEEVDSASLDGATEEQTALIDSAVSCERLVAAIDTLFQAYGDKLRPDEIGPAIDEAAAYYRRNLADEVVTKGKALDGSEVDVPGYVMKDSVREALGEENAEILETYRRKLDTYQVRYVEMLIDEAQAKPAEALVEAVKEISEEYELLDAAQREEVENLNKYAELEELARQQAESGGTGEGGQTEETTEQTGNVDGSGDDSQTETPDQTEETPQTEKYTVRVVTESGSVEEWEREPGETVILTAQDEKTQKFERWEITPETVELRYTGVDQYTVEFTMPQEDVTVKKIYTALPDVIQSYVDNFIALAEKALTGGAAEEPEYVTNLGTAVSFYQQWLAEIVSEFADEETTMQQYQLKAEIQSWLASQGRTDDLAATYKTLCLTYARALFESLDPDALDRDTLETASEIYGLLGSDWQGELEADWQSESGDASTASMGDMLKVYEVFLLFQEYQNLDPDASMETRMEALQKVYKAYQDLTDEQKLLAAANQALVEALKENGLWEEPESETEDNGYMGGDFGDYGGEGYTASELKELIENKEREIKECALTIREEELKVDQQQRIVDGKIVKSTMDGTVISIGTEDGNTDYDYFVKVANVSGLFAKGAMNELALETIHVGDAISGMMTNTGVSFTAVIKEISEYPDPDGGSMSFGTENTNASYYTFYALLDDTEGIEEGEAEIQLTASASGDTDDIYLENYFVRTENDGRSYVYMQGDDGKLKKQYVTTGKSLYSYAIQIVSGLELTDNIAFPYGKSVVEGAQTKEVEVLQDAYM